MKLASFYVRVSILSKYKYNSVCIMSLQPIPSNTEIKVWYSAEYAEMMGKPLLPDPKPIVRDAPATAQGTGM